MLGITQNPSTRNLAKGLFCAGLLAMALLLTLVVAGASAAVSADQAVAPSTSEGGSTLELTPESSTPPPGSEAPSTGVPKPTPPEVTQPPVTALPEVTQPPATPLPEVTQPPVSTLPEVAQPPATPVAPTPQPPPPVEAKTTAPPATETVEATTPKPVTEATAASVEPTAATSAEAALSVAAPSTGQIADGLTSPPAGPQQNAAPPEAAPVEASSVLLGRLALGAGGRSGPPRSGPGAAAAADVVGVVDLSPAQRAAELSCELSGMAGSVTNNCRAEVSGQASLSAPAAGFRAPTGSRTGPPNDGYGNSSGGSHPAIPAPAPAPSGAVGGSAAGGSGVALSGFFTLAGLLLLAAPRALRRLRLSCQPWRAAFFVLIPERPG